MHPEPTMSLDDAQLRKVFDLVDVGQTGRINLDQLRSVAASANLSSPDDLDFLSKLDADGSGLVDFENFRRGVHTLMQRRATLSPPSSPYIGNGRDLSPVNGEHDFEGIGELPSRDDEDSPVIMRRGNGLARRSSSSSFRTPNGRRPLKRSSSVACTSQEFTHADLVNAELSVARGQVQRLQEQNAALEDQLHDQTAKYNMLQRRCDEYERALKESEDQSRVTRDASLTQMSTAVSRLSHEKDALESEYVSRIAELELELSRLKDDNADLNCSLDFERKAASAAQERAATVGSKLAEADEQVYQAQEAMKATLQQQQKESEELLQTAIKREREAIELEMNELRLRIEHLVQQAEKDHRDHEEQVHTLESELATLRERNAQLEAAVADPEEFERQFIQSGLKMASGQTGESLAAELNEASREDLLDEIRSLGDETQQLRSYIDRLLATVIDRIPDILEIRR